MRSTRTSSSPSSVTATPPPTSNVGPALAVRDAAGGAAAASSAKTSGVTDGRRARPADRRASSSARDGHERDASGDELLRELLPLLLVRGVHDNGGGPRGVLLDGRELALPAHPPFEGARALRLVLVVHGLHVVFDGLHLARARPGEGAAEAQAAEGHVDEAVELLARGPEVD